MCVRMIREEIMNANISTVVVFDEIPPKKLGNLITLQETRKC